MQLPEFARYVRPLEETSSRTALVGILAELFGATPPDEIAHGEAAWHKTWHKR
jgi:hypothetical protein